MMGVKYFGTNFPVVLRYGGIGGIPIKWVKGNAWRRRKEERKKLCVYNGQLYL